jgi:ABC-type branched-subunit amino acid transport system substrate-binding protein
MRSHESRGSRGAPLQRRCAALLVVGSVILIGGCGTRIGTPEIIKAEGGDGSPVATTPQSGTSGGTQGAGTANGATTQGGVAGNSTGASGGTSTAGAGSGTGATGSTTGSTAGSTTGSTASGGSTAGASSGSKKSSKAKSGKSGGSVSTAAAATCTTEGPPVVIGQVGTFSGLVGANFQGAIKTPYVWVDNANAHGGLGCHPIHFIQMDDQSDPATSEADVEQLVTQDHAVALFAAFTPLDMAGFLAGVDKEGVAVIGGDQSEPDWTTDKNLFPVGGTARAAIAGSVQQAAHIGRKKIAVLSCVEAAACGANFYDTIIKDGFAKKFGMKVVYSGTISITQPDFTAQCQDAKNAGADTIAFGLDRAGLQRAAQSCASLNYFPTLPLIALQGSFDPTDPNIRKDGAYLSSPTFPYLENSLPAEQTFHAAMKQYAPSAPIDTSASIVWSDGQMLQQVVSELGTSAQSRALTMADFFNGAAKIHDETLGGLVPPTTYKTGAPQAENPCYFGIQFGHNGTFTAPGGNKPACI